MPELKARDAMKPFCPVHHWRMAYDSTTGKAWNSAEAFYRCSFETCTMRFSLTAGYYDSTVLADDPALLAQLEIATCQQDREHHPCIVSYAKESVGSRTEEWRQWRCFDGNCGFSFTQKLSQQESQRMQSPVYDSRPAPVVQHQRTLARR